MAPRKRIPVVERVLAKVTVEDRGHLTPCWIWNGWLHDNGYGRIETRAKGTKVKRQRTHRVTYEHFVGPIPEGLEPDHLCRIRACCNPDHLEPVTHAENSRRSNAGALTRARYAAQTHCKYGHEYTPENTITRDVRGYACRHCRICENAAQRCKKAEKKAKRAA